MTANDLEEMVSRGRNSDNTRIKQVLGLQPSITLEVGLDKTYKWIADQLRKQGRLWMLRTRELLV
jgi:nucleoside-diphosphate-sugar epimerase